MIYITVPAEEENFPPFLIILQEYLYIFMQKSFTSKEVICPQYHTDIFLLVAQGC